MHYICNGLGGSKEDPSIDDMRSFLAALDPADEEHGAAWVSGAGGHTLEYSVDGNLCFDCPDRDPRHLTSVPTPKVLELWLKLARAQVEELEREPWLPGTRAPLSPEEQARRHREFAGWQFADDREFYEGLGPERDGDRCCTAQCGRGTVSLSVFCRRHHFENMRGRPCPFER